MCGGEGIDFNRVRSIKQDGISIEIAESDQIKLKAKKKKNQYCCIWNIIEKS